VGGIAGLPVEREERTMPQYVFRCEECGKEFEQSMHIADLDHSTARCPHCGSERSERQVAEFSAVTSKKS
jgi:putative FmdB family regulatory protein